jgi:hypothetical protein
LSYGGLYIYGVASHSLDIQKGNPMAFKPNYRLQRADRNRAAQARSEEKQRKREEKAAQRKALRTAGHESPPNDEKA